MPNRTHRIVFVTELDVSVNDGYVRKIFGQMGAFAGSGFDVYLLAHKGRRLYLSKSVSVQPEKEAEEPKPALSMGPFGKALMQMRLCIAATRAVVTDQIGFVYVRRFTPATPVVPFWLAIMRLINRSVLYEYPTFPYSQENRSLSPVFRIVDGLCAPIVDRTAKKLCVVRVKDTAQSVRHLEIVNGVDVADYPLRRPRPHRGLVMIAVATMQVWHGLDRIIVGLAQDTSGDGHLNIVGTGPELPRLVSLVQTLGIQSQVTFHGALYGKRLDSLFDAADIAIGSLGMHRIAATVGSTTKSRQYCCRGIPQVIGYRDLVEESGSVLRVPGSESPVDIARIRTFVAELKADPVEIRKYAARSLGWPAAMQTAVQWVRCQTRVV